MAYKKGIAGALAGMALMAAAAYLGFSAHNWILAIIASGVGGCIFIAGVQYENPGGM